ncbi:hypothetical protein LT493_35480 [Streptomyces tricolor]|nr:hypothetical protein [Streptomyces tricolor]
MAALVLLAASYAVFFPAAWLRTELRGAERAEGPPSTPGGASSAAAASPCRSRASGSRPGSRSGTRARGTPTVTPWRYGTRRATRAGSCSPRTPDAGPWPRCSPYRAARRCSRCWPRPCTCGATDGPKGSAEAV